MWHLKQSQLYALLARHAEAGYVSESLDEQGTRPPRKVMSLTPSGMEAFDNWLVNPVEHGRDFRMEFLAKLSFAHQAGPELARCLIKRQRVACQDWLGDLNAQTAPLDEAHQYDWLVVQFRISQINAILS